MIGRAFFVYWPGFLPLTAQGPNLLPDLGRAPGFAEPGVLE